MRLKYGHLAQLFDSPAVTSEKISETRCDLSEQYGHLAQLVEHLVYTEAVRSSSLLVSTILSNLSYLKLDSEMN